MADITCQTQYRSHHVPPNLSLEGKDHYAHRDMKIAPGMQQQGQVSQKQLRLNDCDILFNSNIIAQLQFFSMVKLLITFIMYWIHYMKHYIISEDGESS